MYGKLGGSGYKCVVNITTRRVHAATTFRDEDYT